MSGSDDVSGNGPRASLPGTVLSDGEMAARWVDLGIVNGYMNRLEILDRTIPFTYANF